MFDWQKKKSVHASFAILYHCGNVFIFVAFDIKTCPFKCQKKKKIKYKGSHLHFKVLSQENHTEGHLPPPPCSLWASMLLMASSFFLCSLYFPSDSVACFIVFCHVSVIAPTACLMLSIYFVCVCAHVGACLLVHMHVCAPLFFHQGRLWVCGAEPSCGRAPHRAKWQPPGRHWLMTVKTLAVNVKWETGCHSEAPCFCAALTTTQQAALQLDSTVMQQKAL